MKIATPEKLKFKRLQRRLKLPLWQAVGLLESLWKMAYRNAPDGAIGRLSNEDIAAAIEWDDDADDLVAALVETAWLDADPTHRLLVHDWENECESWLRGNFEKTGKAFAKPTIERESSDDDATKQTIEQPSTKPSFPSPTLSSPPPPSLEPGWAEVEVDLKQAGVGLAADACLKARAAGCKPLQVQNTITFWRSQIPRWNQGALYKKISGMNPGEQFEQGWPNPTAAWERLQKKQDRDDDGKKLQAKRKARDEELKRNAAERKRSGVSILAELAAEEAKAVAAP